MSRYHITAHGSTGAKARIRTALKLMGFEHVRIEEKADEATPERPAPKADNIPTSPEALAIADLFKRQHETPWAEEEITAFKAAMKTGIMTLENIKLVAAHYERARKLPDSYCRTSVLQLAKHFHTELDKARVAKPTSGKSLEWAPSNVVPMPPLSDEERARGLAKLRAFKEQQRGGNGA